MTCRKASQNAQQLGPRGRLTAEDHLGYGGTGSQKLFHSKK